MICTNTNTYESSKSSKNFYKFPCFPFIFFQKGEEREIDVTAQILLNIETFVFVNMFPLLSIYFNKH